jgi:prephenate dehydrogenase
MTVVGFGPMGRRFTSLFSSDFNVCVSSSRNVGEEVAEIGATVVTDRSDALASSDYIFLSVPLTALPALIDEVNTYSKEDTMIIDCFSARVPAEQLLSRLNRRHFGMHDIKKDEYCITGQINDEMTEFFHRRGISVNCMSPEEHDRINAVIGIGHFVGLSLGHFLSDDEKDILADIGSGSKVMAVVSHFVGNNPTTWRETQVDNQFTKERRAELIKALIQYHDSLSNGKYPFGYGSEQTS